MNVSSALAIVFGVCVGAIVASTMGILVLPDNSSAAAALTLQHSMSLSLSGTVTRVSSDSFLLKEDPYPGRVSRTILIHYDNDTAMLVRTITQDEQGLIVDSRLLQTDTAKTIKSGLRIRTTVWLSPNNTTPYAMIIFISPTQ